MRLKSSDSIVREQNEYIAEQVQVSKNSRVIDMGCGKGEIALLLAKENPDSRFISLGFSDESVYKGDKKARESCLTNISFIKGCDNTTCLKENSFDCATMDLGDINVTEYKAVIEETHRLLKPQGKFICLSTDEIISREELMNIMGEVGFNITQSTILSMGNNDLYISNKNKAIH